MMKSVFLLPLYDAIVWWRRKSCKSFILREAFTIFQLPTDCEQKFINHNLLPVTREQTQVETVLELEKMC
jgi:hypothetical protein